MAYKVVQFRQTHKEDMSEGKQESEEGKEGEHSHGGKYRIRHQLLSFGFLLLSVQPLCMAVVICFLVFSAS